MRASYILTTIILLSISVANTSPLPGRDLRPQQRLQPSSEQYGRYGSDTGEHQPTENEKIHAQRRKDNYEQARKAALDLWPDDRSMAFKMANLVALEMTKIGDMGQDAWKKEREKHHSSLEGVDTGDYKKLANAVGLDQLTQKPELNDALPPSFIQRPSHRLLSPSFGHHDTMKPSQPTEKAKIRAQRQKDNFEQARDAALELWPQDREKAFTMARFVALEMTQIGDMGQDAWKKEREKHHSSLEGVDTGDYKSLANAVGLDKLTQKDDQA
ncbi:hypothetical protein H0H93_016326 [Arthromyces matolae]|nr:hypothetical protein H0H93_016326 [Arthromyces matolae]